MKLIPTENKPGSKAFIAVHTRIHHKIPEYYGELFEICGFQGSGILSGMILQVEKVIKAKGGTGNPELI